MAGALLLALTGAPMIIAGLCVVRGAPKTPWLAVIERSAQRAPYRASWTTRRIEHAPLLVRVAALSGLLFSQGSILALTVALVDRQWGGIVVGLLPFAALGFATAVAVLDLLRPDERSRGRVRVISVVLLAYALPLVGFGALHLCEARANAVSFGFIAMVLGGAGSISAALMLASYKHLAATPPAR